MALDVWVVIPTAGRSTLEGAVDSTGVPRERIVIVHTGHNVTLIDGTIAVLDQGPVNIQRWWNRGLDVVAARGGRYALVLNDDARISNRDIGRMVRGLQMTGAALACPGTPGLVVGGSKYQGRTLTGWCWMLDLATGLRPDESYRWWFGDDDLDWRARRDHGGIVTLPMRVEHLHPNELTFESQGLQALASLDAERWRTEKF